MPNRRVPLAKAEATGATKVNPARFKDRKEAKSKPLGKPSRTLKKHEVIVWYAFVHEIPWLMECDRAVLEQASRVRAQLWRDKELDLKAIGVLSRLLAQLGATPTDRSKVMVPPDDSQGAAEEFLN